MGAVCCFHRDRANPPFYQNEETPCLIPVEIHEDLELAIRDDLELAIGANPGSRVVRPHGQWDRFLKKVMPRIVVAAESLG